MRDAPADRKRLPVDGEVRGMLLMNQRLDLPSNAIAPAW
jgi:hypothetical protein